MPVLQNSRSGLLRTLLCKKSPVRKVPSGRLALFVVGSMSLAWGGSDNWDPPAINYRPSHDAAARDERLADALVESGKQLFRTKFNVVDGAGRPGATGDSKPTVRAPISESFTRVAGPDANSCAGCHNEPSVGGSGDFAANVFVGAHFTDPPTRSIETTVTNERHTISIFGAGAIELLAREISEDLRSLKLTGLKQSRASGHDTTVAMKSKGISFGHIIVHPDGTYTPYGLEGIDEDLVVKPFGAKGVAVSLREFTIFALNQHHGMQAEERFGWERTGVRDFDADGVEEEITVGQVSALSLYQASLPPPSRKSNVGNAAKAQILIGKKRFQEIGCENCHISRLPLIARQFTEPNPFNRPGAAGPGDLKPVRIPIPVSPDSGVFESTDNQLYVAAYTDFKRHKICDTEDPYFCNERLPQDFVPPDEFITAKLWDVGTSAPYGHRGDLTTITEAILHHSAQAKESRKAFQSLTDNDKKAVVRFLLSFRVVPPKED
jgi:hypothetical protein